jgi:type IV pilus assembly protein PilW
MFTGGFSLIELMIAMVIGLAFSLAVMQVLSVAESRRRSSNSVNDIDQTAAYAMYDLDKYIRSAGSGFASMTRAPATVGNNYGCKINASLSSTAILPAPSLPAPFSNVLSDVGGKIRLAPILIDYNGSHFGTGTSDVLIVMAGSAGYSEGAMTFSSLPTSSQLNVQNDYGFNPNSPAAGALGDLVLLVDANSGSNVQACMIEQVDTSHGPTGGTALPLAGTYYSATGTDPSTAAVASFSINGQVMNLGNPTVGKNPPLFQMFGVKEGSSSTDYALYSYDLLKISNPGVATVIADQVFEIHALYYVDTDALNATGYGVGDAWLSPNPAVTTSVVNGIQYDASHLMAGTTAAADALYRIKAIRLGMILRTPLSEQTQPGPSSVTLFSGLTDPGGADLHIKRTFTGNELNYRYRALEATIPIRNNQNCVYSATNSC